MSNTKLPKIVIRAMLDTVTNIGQLTDKEIRDLEKYVKKGTLIKGKGGPFPKLKTVYAIPGFNFKDDREKSIAAMNEIVQKMNEANGYPKV